MHTPTLQRCLGGVLRRPWIFTAITVASCAGFAARAAAALVAAEPSLPTPHEPLGPRPIAAPPLIHALDGGQLVTRNMFCSSCGPASPAGDATFMLSPAVLIETSVGGEPRATLRVVASEVQGSWGLGDTVPGLGRLDRIASSWVELVDPTGRRGRLSLIEPAAGDGADTAMLSSPPAAGPWAGRITKIDEEHYEVDRALVRELVSGFARPAGVRVVPVFEQGEIQGARLLGVASTSIAAAIGLRSRDTLISIDGEPIKAAQQVIDLYARLDQLSSVALGGTRDGKPLVRHLQLR